MKIEALGILMCLWLSAATAYGYDALHYYNLGEKSSIDSRRIDYFNKALQLNPNLVQAYEKRAILYYFQRRYEQAIQDYTRVIAFWPDNLEAYRIRGMAFLKKGEFDLAISDFDHALELNPKLVSAYSYRAEAYRLKGMPDNAIHDASAAINLKGGDLRALANAYSTRAKIYQQLGKDDLAQADFRKSYELDPRFAVLRYFYGTFRLEDVHRMGLVGIIGLLFVGIFKLSLPAPRKKNEDR